MATLEEKVLKGLRRKKTEECLRLLQEPPYQAKIKKTLQVGLQSLFDTFSGENNAPTEEEKVMAKELLDAQIEEIYKNPDLLRKQAGQQVSTYLLTRKEMKQLFEPLYQQLRESKEFDDEALQELQRANRHLDQTVKRDERILANFVTIARRKGIDYALTDEAEYAVLRRIFPKKKDYLAYMSSSRRVMKEWVVHVREAMLMDGEAGRDMASFISKIMAVMEETYQRTLQEEVEMRAEERAARIYGNGKKR